MERNNSPAAAKILRVQEGSENYAGNSGRGVLRFGGETSWFSQNKNDRPRAAGCDFSEDVG